LDAKTKLNDPQSLNSYSYAGDNPITGRDPEGLLTQAQNAALTSIATQLQGILTVLNAISSSGGSLSPAQAASIQQTIFSAQGAVRSIANGGNATVVPQSTKWAPQTGQSGITPTNSITNSGPIPVSKADTAMNIGALGICGGGSGGVGSYGSVSGCGVISVKDYGFIATGGGGGTTGATVGGGPTLMISNAHSVEDLKGIDIYGGGSTEVFGIDIAHSAKDNIWSVTLGPVIGPKLSPPFLPWEAHGGAQTTLWAVSHDW
jgi:hypothetical protein